MIALDIQGTGGGTGEGMTDKFEFKMKVKNNLFSVQINSYDETIKT